MLNKLLQSRTIITLAVMFVLGGFQALQPFLTPDVYGVVNSVLLIIAGYFRVNPNVSFSDKV